jgi:hypothetical protein
MRERLELGRKASWPGRRRKCGARVASDRLKRRQLGERSGARENLRNADGRGVFDELVTGLINHRQTVKRSTFGEVPSY